MEKNFVTFIIQIFLDLDGWKISLTKEWIEWRMAFFHEFTLKSILNQSFQNFRIFMLCNPKNARTTVVYPWDSRIEVCYDRGRLKYEKLDSKFVSISRIDSDDLFHRDAMKEVSENLILSDKRECLVFKKNLLWDIPNRLIGTHYRKGPPFFTHIFSKSIYKNWEKFCSLHYVPHGVKSGSNRGKELSNHKICVVKHKKNYARERWGLPPEVVHPKKLARMKSIQALDSKNKTVVSDPSMMKEILKDFGVKEACIES